MVNPYPPRPRWDGSNAAPQPVLVNNVGYEVTAVRFPDARREAAYGAANATINNNTFQWPMFITDLGIDMALAGTMAQSRTTRDFYPHNFVQPSFVLQGQALDQEDYGHLCEFLHYAQQNTLRQDNNLMQLWVKGYGLNGNRPSLKKVQISNSKTTSLNQTHGNQVMRGSHQTVLCQGYINAMPRQHQFGVVSPTYTFSFVVAHMMQGIYSEDEVAITKQQTWVDILTQTSNLSTNKTLIAETNKILAFAQAHQGDILNTGQ